MATGTKHSGEPRFTGKRLHIMLMEKTVQPDPGCPKSLRLPMHKRKLGCCLYRVGGGPSVTHVTDNVGKDWPGRQEELEEEEYRAPIRAGEFER
jgi:hypothetical protein